MHRFDLSLLVAVTGFGPPNLEHKKELLEHNLTIIRATFPGNVTVKLFNYGDQSCDCSLVDQEIMGTGYVGQFIYRSLVPDTITADYVICMLDDIKLDPEFNICRAIKNLEHYDLDIIQPALTLNSAYSHKCMLKDEGAGMRLTTFMEYFCYIMTAKGYRKWYTLFDRNTTWMWGIDLCMDQYHIRMGLIDCTPLHHYYKRDANQYTEHPCPKAEKKETLKRLTGSNNIPLSFSTVNVAYI